MLIREYTFLLLVFRLNLWSTPIQPVSFCVSSCSSKKRRRSFKSQLVSTLSEFRGSPGAVSTENAGKQNYRRHQHVSLPGIGIRNGWFDCDEEDVGRRGLWTNNNRRNRKMPFNNFSFSRTLVEQESPWPRSRQTGVGSLSPTRLFFLFPIFLCPLILVIPLPPLDVFLWSFIAFLRTMMLMIDAIRSGFRLPSAANRTTEMCVHDAPDWIAGGHLTALCFEFSTSLSPAAYFIVTLLRNAIWLKRWRSGVRSVSSVG